MPTEKDVLAALGTVMDPELNVSLVQAGMVKGVRVDGGPHLRHHRAHHARLPAEGEDPGRRRGRAQGAPRA